MQILAERREFGLANEMVNQKDYPSWNTLIKYGIMLEGWDGTYAQMPSCGGAVGTWLFESVLGIQRDPTSPGFKRFILAPQPDPATGLMSAHGHYDSAVGRIETDWRCEGKRFFLNCTVPFNSTATIYLPSTHPASLTEAGQPMGGNPAIKYVRQEAGFAVFEVQSGRYAFAVDR